VWADSHCHIPYEGVPEDAIAAALAAGVGRLIDVGTDVDQSLAALEMACAHEQVWATIGLHPHEAKTGLSPVEELVAAWAGHPKLVGIGECGLDYHYDLSGRDEQRSVFAAQVGLAQRYGLALVIHTREAWDDTFAILRAEGVPEHTVFHCFTGGPAEAAIALELGAWLSFSGIITFKTAADLRAAAALAPLDRILVETDSPYLAPVPHRGKPNVPAFVPLVGAAVAAAKDLPVAEVEAATWANTAAVFGLPA
jgi:TatD DNase family protein